MHDYTDRLMNVFYYRVILFLFIIILATLSGLFCYILNEYKKRKTIKNDSKLSKTKLTRRITELASNRNNIIIRSVIVYILILALFFISALPVYQDAVQGRIIVTEAIYSRKDIDYRSRTPNIGGYVTITVDDKDLSMELYPDFSEEMFPEGTYHAVVWYGEKSKVLLNMELLDDPRQP